MTRSSVSVAVNEFLMKLGLSWRQNVDLGDGLRAEPTARLLSRQQKLTSTCLDNSTDILVHFVGRWQLPYSMVSCKRCLVSLEFGRQRAIEKLSYMDEVLERLVGLGGAKDTAD